LEDMHRWNKNMKMALTKLDLEGMHWISLAPQDRDKWQAVVSKRHLHHQRSDIRTLMMKTKNKSQKHKLI
jgi:hypothetical protein